MSKLEISKTEGSEGLKTKKFSRVLNSENVNFFIYENFYFFIENLNISEILYVNDTRHSALIFVLKSISPSFETVKNKLQFEVRERLRLLILVLSEYKNRGFSSVIFPFCSKDSDILSSLKLSFLSSLDSRDSERSRLRLIPSLSSYELLVVGLSSLFSRCFDTISPFESE